LVEQETNKVVSCDEQIVKLENDRDATTVVRNKATRIGSNFRSLLDVEDGEVLDDGQAAGNSI